VSLAAHACPPSRRSTWEAVRSIARTNPTVAACVGLVDNNGLSREEGLAAAVIELARVNQEQADEIMTLRLGRPLPDRDDDDHALCCGEIDCRCLPGGAA